MTEHHGDVVIRCDCCEVATYTVNGGTVGMACWMAQRNGWECVLGLWSCAECVSAGAVPAGLDGVRVRIAE